LSQPKTLPVASLLLLAANIAAAFLTVLQPDLAQRYGFIPGDPQPLAALTSLFLHVNLIHLLGNMVFLAAAGPPTEAAVGPLRFFGVYVSAGLLGVAAHWMLGSNPDVPLIGASGAVAGCAMLGSVRFYRERVMLAPNVTVPLIAVSAIWLILQAVGGVVRLNDELAGTSYWSHLGGAVGGLLLALAYRAPREADRLESHRVIESMASRGPAASLAAAEKHLAQHPGDLKAMVQRAEALANLGESSEAQRAFSEAVERAPDGLQAEVLERVISCGCAEGLPSHRRTMLAAKLKEHKPELAGQLLESVVRGPADDGQRPDAMLALAEIRRDTDPATAGQLLRELYERYPLHPAAELARAKGWNP
jgi:membrane associated rhomboid family serine protease